MRRTYLYLRAGIPPKKLCSCQAQVSWTWKMSVLRLMATACLYCLSTADARPYPQFPPQHLLTHGDPWRHNIIYWLYLHQWKTASWMWLAGFVCLFGALDHTLYAYSIFNSHMLFSSVCLPIWLFSLTHTARRSPCHVYSWDCEHSGKLAATLALISHFLFVNLKKFDCMGCKGGYQLRVVSVAGYPILNQNNRMWTRRYDVPWGRYDHLIIYFLFMFWPVGGTPKQVDHSFFFSLTCIWSIGSLQKKKKKIARIDAS